MKYLHITQHVGTPQKLVKATRPQNFCLHKGSFKMGQYTYLFYFILQYKTINPVHQKWLGSTTQRICT